MRFTMTAASWDEAKMKDYVARLREAGFAVSDVDDDSVDLDYPYKKMVVEIDTIEEFLQLTRTVRKKIILDGRCLDGDEYSITIYDDYME